MFEVGQFVYGVEIVNYDVVSEHGDTLTEVTVHFGKIVRITTAGDKVRLEDGSVHGIEDVCANEQQFRDMLTFRVGDGPDVWYKVVDHCSDNHFIYRFVASTCCNIAEDEWGDRYIDYIPESETIRIMFDDGNCCKKNMNQIINDVYDTFSERYKFVHNCESGERTPFDDPKEFPFKHAYRINYNFEGTRSYACPNCGECNNDWDDSEYCMDSRSWENTRCCECGCDIDRYWHPTTIAEIVIRSSDKYEDPAEDAQNDNQ
jgi:hypothetical protein